MHLLDMRTVLVSYAISDFICSLVMFFLWRQNRVRFAGLNFWLADFVLQFAGVSLVALRGVTPDFLSIVVSNTLLAVGTWLLYIGLERFFDRRSPQIHNYLLLAVLPCVQLYFTYVQPALVPRNINIHTFQFVLCLQCLWLVTYRAAPEIRPAARRVSAAFASLGLLSLANIALSLFVPISNNFLQANTLQASLIMSIQMAYLGLTFSLILLVNRRLLMESIREISARQRAQRALDESERGARNIFENVPIGMFQTTPEGKLVDANPAGAAIFGYASPAEVIEIVNQSSLAEVLYEDPQRRPMLVNAVEQAAGGWRTFENRFRRQDGRIIDTILTFCERTDPLTAQNRLYGFIQDITESKQIEIALRALSTRYAALLDTIPDIIAEVDQNKVYTWVNQAGRQFFGEQVIGREAAFYFEGEQQTYQIVQPLFDGREDVIYVESWQRRQDGEKRLLAWRCRAMFGAQGQVTGTLSTAHDITERVRYEQALRESEQKFREIFESSLVGIFRTTRQGQYLLVNPAFANIMGYDSPEDMIQATQDIATQVYVDPTERARRLALLDRQDAISYESCMRRKDGRIISVRVDDRGCRDANGEILFYEGTIIDITQQRQAEDKLKALLKEKEILLREVHHRVKNNLQAIVYLIEMQSAHFNDETGKQFLKELEGQTRAMSLVYEQVYQSENLAQVNMVSYLEKLVDNVLIAFAGGRAIQLHLELAPLSLNVEQAMPCGLIVNELVTNSLKYAFPPDYPGAPAINIRLRPDGDQVRLSVGDNGRGFPTDLDWQTSRSLGLRLARLWATHQLGGEMVAVSENGLSFHFSFKKSG